jgi:adenosylmethionine-8-amino-7-oxononanoate aminotransferase
VDREELRAWDRELVWHAFTQMAEYEPLIIESGQGCALVDIDGRRYLDGVSSLWCNIHGHRHPRLDAALREQLERIAHTTNLGASNPTTIRLAKRLVDLAPSGLSHVFFSDDGATAVEVAIKIAFQYWRQLSDPRPEKTRFLALEAAYHGDTIGSVSVGGIDRFHGIFQPLLFEALRAPAPDMYRLPEGVTAESALTYYLGRVEAILAEHHATIAAMVMEPLVQGAAGMIVHPRGFLAGVRELTRRYGVLLILDEVAVGFGRTGKMFACEHEGVSPDLLCLAKGLTGGYLPMAATLATDELWQAFLGQYHESKTLFHGHTYGGNPLAAAVALASLEVFEAEHTLEQLPPTIFRLREQLDRLAGLTHVGDVRQCGLIGAAELVQDKETKAPFPWQRRVGHRVCLAARRRGVLLRPLGDVIVIMPPLAVSIGEIDQIARAIEHSINDVCSAELTP